jgi:hypothetical protein
MAQSGHHQRSLKAHCTAANHDIGGRSGFRPWPNYWQSARAELESFQSTEEINVIIGVLGFWGQRPDRAEAE